MGSDADSLIARVGWDPRRDVPTPPNTLMKARGSAATRRCSVITEHGPCPDYSGYVDTSNGDSFCIVHARAINDLPESIAKRNAVVEMAMSSLANMTADAVSVIAQIMQDEDAPHGVRLKAATEVLDRTGLAKSAALAISISDQPLHVAGPADEVRERLDRLAVAANVIVFPQQGDAEAEEEAAEAEAEAEAD